jgi:hypothetical protein
MSSLRMQQVLSRFLPTLQKQQALSHQQLTVCRHLQQCRTAVLGGFLLHCGQCGHETTLYHACRNRHCTRCQQQATQQWCDKQASHLLPVTYYHLVFTLPHALNGWIRLHPRVIYGLLFRTVWYTLSRFGKDPKRLGGELGMSAVLHTWGQTLDQHVHLHCLVPGGALNLDGTWREAKSTYLFPVKALSRVYRGKMISALRDAANEGQLSRVTRPDEIDHLLNSLMQTPWVVFAKPCLQHTRSIIDYLGRYTHRIALSDNRLSHMDEETVSFSYRDYRDNGKKVMTLAGTEFLRRFLQHVLPKGFMRVRHFGWLANASRAKKLPLIRAAIAEDTNPQPQTSNDATERIVEHFTGLPCPCCQQAIMLISALLKPQRLEGG